MAFASLVISIFAFVAAVTVAVLQLRTARQSNALPVLVDLFAEHRSDRLAEARTFVRKELRHYDLTRGLAGIPQPQREQVRDLGWYYDNLGTLVAHGHVDVEPVSGYLGDAIVGVWQEMEPLIHAERAFRGHTTDPQRWQVYFENLVRLVEECPPDQARQKQRNWKL